MDRSSISNGSHDERSATDQDLQIVYEDQGPEYESVGGRIWRHLYADGSELQRQRHGGAGRTSCDLGKNYGMKADVHGKIHILDSENGTGSMEATLTGNGQTMNGVAAYAGKWIGESCPTN